METLINEVRFYSISNRFNKLLLDKVESQCKELFPTAKIFRSPVNITTVALQPFLSVLVPSDIDPNRDYELLISVQIGNSNIEYSTKVTYMGRPDKFSEIMYANFYDRLCSYVKTEYSDATTSEVRMVVSKSLPNLSEIKQRVFKWNNPSIMSLWNSFSTEDLPFELGREVKRYNKEMDKLVQRCKTKINEYIASKSEDNFI